MNIQTKIDAIKADNKHSEKVTPRELVEYFGYSRRSWRNCLYIKNYLNEHEIELSSDLYQEWFDAEMEMRHKTVATTKVPEDAIKRVFSMAAANHKPIYVKRNDTVEHAITLMQLHDYSQLPVIGSTERNIIGHISWKTIGLATRKGTLSNQVNDFMSNKITVIDRTEPLLNAIRILSHEDFVVVRNEDQTMGGIITTADMASEFLTITQAEAFLLLEQIELQIRNFISRGNILVEDLQKECKEPERKVESIDDLTFGEYIRIIENPKYWEKFNAKTERAEFVKHLSAVREVRNDVMHFEPDGIDEDRKQLLRNMARFLTELL